MTCPFCRRGGGRPYRHYGKLEVHPKGRKSKVFPPVLLAEYVICDKCKGYTTVESRPERGGGMTGRGAEAYQLYQGDCLEVMPLRVPDGSISLILCDLPYGTTSCDWDVLIPFEPLWKEYRRVIKETGAIILTATQPFTTDVVNSNRKWFKYELIWDKGRGYDPQLSNNRPMKSHENILVFGKRKITYNPQMTPCKPYSMSRTSLNKKDGSGLNLLNSKPQDKTYTKKFPVSIAYFGSDRGLHSTQKPLALLEYLIRTYSNEDDLILDNCMGSGSTVVAALNTKRRCIGIEKDPKIFKLAKDRVANPSVFATYRHKEPKEGQLDLLEVA